MDTGPVKKFPIDTISIRALYYSPFSSTLSFHIAARSVVISETAVYIEWGKKSSCGWTRSRRRWHKTAAPVNVSATKRPGLRPWNLPPPNPQQHWNNNDHKTWRGYQSLLKDFKSNQNLTDKSQKRDWWTNNFFYSEMSSSSVDDTDWHTLLVQMINN